MVIETIEFWHWLVIGVFFLALEVVAPGAILMWFGFGGLLTGFLLWLIPSISLEWQVLIFAVFSGISVLAWRKLGTHNQRIETDQPYLNNRLQSYIGQKTVLIEAIENGSGLAKVGDSAWKVQGDDLPKGTRVKIVGLNGVFFKVEAV
jgi:membrane protein implicated in regulation of membrane protease activity